VGLEVKWSGVEEEKAWRPDPSMFLQKYQDEFADLIR
jgi:hypothetical protein